MSTIWSVTSTVWSSIRSKTETHAHDLSRKKSSTLQFVHSISFLSTDKFRRSCDVKTAVRGYPVLDRTRRPSSIGKPSWSKRIKTRSTSPESHIIAILSCTPDLRVDRQRDNQPKWPRSPQNISNLKLLVSRAHFLAREFTIHHESGMLCCCVTEGCFAAGRVHFANNLKFRLSSENHISKSDVLL